MEAIAWLLFGASATWCALFLPGLLLCFWDVPPERWALFWRLQWITFPAWAAIHRLHALCIDLKMEVKPLRGILHLCWGLVLLGWILHVK